MDAAALSVEQLAVLSRAVPDDQERKDLDLYLAGKHPKHKCAPAGLHWVVRLAVWCQGRCMQHPASLSASVLDVALPHWPALHPTARGLSDVEKLGTVERYFVEVKGIPRLAERIRCFIFSRTYRATHTRVRLAGWRGACVERAMCPAVVRTVHCPHAALHAPP